jgi:hypothetical protein
VSGWQGSNMDGRTCVVTGSTTQSFPPASSVKGGSVTPDASGDVTWTCSAGTYAYAEMSFW